MSYAVTLAGIWVVHLMAVMSPGPAFVTLTRISIGEKRRAALAAAFGLATAALIWAVGASLGIHLLLEKAAWLYGGLRLAGGAYLIWLGIEAWRHAGAGLAPAVAGTEGMSPWRAWRTGLATNFANPKVIVFFGSIFVALFAPETPLWVRIAALALVALNECLWFTLLALVFSSASIQSVYRRAKRWIDRVTGAAMILFGARLIADARS
jgi:threonine efflux protein